MRYGLTLIGIVLIRGPKSARTSGAEQLVAVGDAFR